MASWFDEEALVKVAPAPLEPGHRWLARKQQEIFEEAAKITEDVLAFRDLDPALTEPPPEWVAALGEDEALKRFRVARSAWMSAKEAPVGIKVAKELVVGISKALGESAQAPRILNMQKVTVYSGKPPEYQVVEVEE